MKHFRLISTSSWGLGDYQVIGFMADKYFAGYIASEVIEED